MGREGKIPGVFNQGCCVNIRYLQPEHLLKRVETSRSRIARVEASEITATSESAGAIARKKKKLWFCFVSFFKLGGARKVSLSFIYNTHSRFNFLNKNKNKKKQVRL